MIRTKHITADGNSAEIQVAIRIRGKRLGRDEMTTIANDATSRIMKVLPEVIFMRDTEISTMKVK